MLKTKYERYYESVTEFGSLDLKLERVDKSLAELLDEVADGRYIHIAGTNGKGSTSYFLEGLLMDAGYSVMLFSSPHIHNITERIRINSIDIDPESFDTLFSEAEYTIKKYNLTFFEGIFIIFMLAVKKYNPDFIILETGLGGTFDATNTSFIAEKLPVITTIAQDHANILGREIKQILFDKLGIIKDNEKIFIGKNEGFINELIHEKCSGKDCVFYSGERLEYASKLYSSPFVYNYLNAHAVAEYLTGKRLEIQRYNLPFCRQEKIGRVIMDGAHNPSGMISLLKNSNFRFEAAVLSSTSDRNISKLADILSTKVPNIILTTIAGNDRSVSKDELVKLPYVFEKDPVIAVKMALAQYDGDILVTGSLYLCSIIRAYMAGING